MGTQHEANFFNQTRKQTEKAEGGDAALAALVAERDRLREALESIDSAIHRHRAEPGKTHDEGE